MSAACLSAMASHGVAALSPTRQSKRTRRSEVAWPTRESRSWATCSVGLGLGLGLGLGIGMGLGLGFGLGLG